jgi:hypothetical protein
MAKRDRLGRGLGALLGDYLGDTEPAGAQSRTLPISAIVPNPFLIQKLILVLVEKFLKNLFQKLQKLL